MKRFLFTLMLVVAMAIGATAQGSDLWVAQAFSRYGKAAGCTEILVTGNKARSIGLSRYHSLEVPASCTAAVESMVAKDGSRAADRETEYRSGRLYYGFYTLRATGGKNRYLFYLNQSLARSHRADRVTLIYMEGRLSKEQVKKLISQ